LDRIEQIRQLGLAKFRANEHEEAVALFDQALALVTDEETRELLTVNKAGALIAMQLDGGEVQQLPRILMRRRNPRHTLLASYHLGTKHFHEKDYRKAGFYFGLALEAVEATGEEGWRSATLVSLGAVAVCDSRNEDAIDYFQSALPLLGDTPEHAVTRAFATQNLGYARMMVGEVDEALEMLHSALGLLKDAGADGYSAETYLDLCMAYLEKNDHENARRFGEVGLAKATEVRQVRNGHYLLGEAAFKAGDVETAEFHFDHLASHYPDFPNLKNLLCAIDLRKVVNFKL
jgi:tetratricopeptide (TPR) repeat protein